MVGQVAQPARQKTPKGPKPNYPLPGAKAEKPGISQGATPCPRGGPLERTRPPQAGLKPLWAGPPRNRPRGGTAISTLRPGGPPDPIGSTNARRRSTWLERQVAHCVTSACNVWRKTGAPRSCVPSMQTLSIMTGSFGVDLYLGSQFVLRARGVEEGGPSGKCRVADLRQGRGGKG